MRKLSFTGIILSECFIKKKSYNKYNFITQLNSPVDFNVRAHNRNRVYAENTMKA